MRRDAGALDSGPMRSRAALLALPSLLLLLAVAAGGRPPRTEHAGDAPAITAVVAHDAPADLPAIDGAPLAPPSVSLPCPTFAEPTADEPLARPRSACGSAFVLSDRPLLL